MIKLNINDLFRSNIGTKKLFTIYLPDLEDENLEIFPDQQAELTGYKIEDGLSFSVTESEVKAKTTCDSCLTEFEISYTLDDTEKQYYLVPPEDVPEDEFELINEKHHEIDVTNLIREAIYLGLPTPKKCTPDCKGLCSTCGQNQNEKECNHDSNSPDTFQPFKNLKDLL